MSQGDNRRSHRGPDPLAFIAAALGAFAVGAVAVGALAIGSLVIGRMRVRRLQVDELVVRRLRVIESDMPDEARDERLRTLDPTDPRTEP